MKKTYPLTIYLVKDLVSNQNDVVKENLEKKEISGIGTLYYSPSTDKFPIWLDLFSGINLKRMFSASASALLLIKVENRLFVLTFGPAGRHFLRKGVTEERFGLITTLNSIDPESFKSIDIKTLESGGMQSRIQSSKPITTEDFGLNVEKDLVRAVVGKSRMDNLGETLVGKDSLRLSLKCELSDIKNYLKICLTQYAKKDYKKNFSWIDNLKEIKDPEQIAELDQKLITEINKKNPENLWLTVPEILDWIDHGGFKYSHREKDVMLDDIHVDTFKDSLGKGVVLLEDLNKKSICRFSKSNELQQDHWRVYKSIYYECNKGGSTFFLTGGKWYEVKRNLVASVNNYWQSISHDKHGINFIDYEHENENKYNIDLAEENKALCMDAKNIPIEGRSKFEFCDVYTKDRKLIHIKRYSGSSTLSHLFNQGYVTAELLFDPESRKRINNKLKEKDFLIQDEDNQPNTNDENYIVIFGIISNAQDDFDLPFFSKMTLMNVSKNLINRGYKVSIVKIKKID